MSFIEAPPSALESPTITTPTINGVLQTVAMQTDLATVAAREAKRVSGTFVSACTAFDVTGLALDTAPSDGIVVVLRGTTVGGDSATFTPRLNGVTTDLNRTGWYGQNAVAPTNYGDAAPPTVNVNATSGAAGSDWLCIWRLESPISGPGRIAKCTMAGLANPATPLWQVAEWSITIRSTAEIVSFGVENTVTNNIAATSTYLARRL